MVDLATDSRTEEVRVAMALNGGVSLAVWMGGCAVELDSARRAHLSTGGGTIYAALVDAFKRVLVLDVMSGASAGGINGALLAGAIVNRRQLTADFVRDRWLGLGDFSTLLHRTSNADPRSLMQGEAFATALQETFTALIYDEPRDGSSADHAPPDVKLDITTTDVAGKPMRFVDYWGQGLEAREYRARFRFRVPQQFSPERLARAARASASFPLAFEPFKINGDDAQLAGLEGPRWLIDGGLLDNAPIAAAIDLIPGRRATRQVRRFVCYVNAEPPVPVEPAPGEPLLTAILGHIISLPRKAPFVDQMLAVDAADAPEPRRGPQPDSWRCSASRSTLLEETANALFDRLSDRSARSPRSTSCSAAPAPRPSWSASTRTCGCHGSRGRSIARGTRTDAGSGAMLARAACDPPACSTRSAARLPHQDAGADKRVRLVRRPSPSSTSSERRSRHGMRAVLERRRARRERAGDRDRGGRDRRAAPDPQRGLTRRSWSRTCCAADRTALFAPGRRPVRALPPPRARARGRPAARLIRGRRSRAGKNFASSS